MGKGYSDEEMTNELKKSQQKAQGIRSDIFKDDFNGVIYYPQAGEKPHWVDILPYRAGKNDPNKNKGQFAYTFEYLCHTQLGPGKTTVICPTMYGEKCPVCEKRDEYLENDDSAWEQFKIKKRNLYNVVSYDSDEEKRKGIQVWDISFHYFEKFLMKISKKHSRSGNKEETILFMSPNKNKGKTITFTIEPPKGKKDYPKFLGHNFEDRDYNIDDKILEGVYTLDSLIEVKSYNEIKDILEGGSGGDDENEKRSESSNNIKWEDMLHKLKKCEDMDNLEDFIDDNDLEKYLDFDIKGDFEDELESIRKQIQENVKPKSGVDAGKELISDDLFLKLENCNDNDDLEEFIDDNNLETYIEFDENIDFEKQKKKIIKAIKTFRGDNDSKSDDSSLKEELKALSWVKLKRYVKEHPELKIDLEEFDKDDMDDLIDEIIEKSPKETGKNKEGIEKSTKETGKNKEFIEKELKALSWVKLKRYVKDNDLDIKLEEFDKDDMDDLIDEIIEKI